MGTNPWRGLPYQLWKINFTCRGQTYCGLGIPFYSQRGVSRLRRGLNVQTSLGMGSFWTDTHVQDLDASIYFPKCVLDTRPQKRLRCTSRVRILTWSLAYLVHTSLKSTQCSSQVTESIQTSFGYAYACGNPFRTTFMNCCKVLDAFIIPNGILSHSYFPPMSWIR